jgi:hypothetical protein
VEPYLFDSMIHEEFDARGVRRETTHQQRLGSLTYLLYGVTDRFTAGMIPTFGYTLSSGSGSSTGVQFGDLALQGQYRLSRFEPGSWLPAASLVVGETFPTGKYDRLGAHSPDAFGAGVHTTTVSLYMQDYFWMPNGRILRSRLDLSYAFSDSASVRDLSVYGTGAGFRGNARPGDSYIADAAWEYSVTRHWVLALDAQYVHNDPTGVTGSSADGMRSVFLSSGASWLLSLAPALEYNWNARVGIIVGAKFSPKGRNTSAPVIPVAALNLVY